MSEERFVYTEGQMPESVGNEQVAGGVCASCRYRTSRAGRCEKYPIKPLEILAGRSACTYYEPDETVSGQMFQVNFPPCVGCVHNAGALLCDALGNKPERVVIRHEPCERREEEKA